MTPGPTRNQASSQFSELDTVWLGPGATRATLCLWLLLQLPASSWEPREPLQSCSISSIPSRGIWECVVLPSSFPSQGYSGSPYFVKRVALICIFKYNAHLQLPVSTPSTHPILLCSSSRTGNDGSAGQRDAFPLRCRHSQSLQESLEAPCRQLGLGWVKVPLCFPQRRVETFLVSTAHCTD